MKAEAKQWLKIAEGDYEMSQYGFKMARYPQALYLLCQAIEKVLKGAQIEFADKTPQRTHRLETIAQKTCLDFSNRQYELLIELTQHYGRVRYPDYSQIAYRPFYRFGEKSNAKGLTHPVATPNEKGVSPIYASFFDCLPYIRGPNDRLIKKSHL